MARRLLLKERFPLAVGRVLLHPVTVNISCVQRTLLIALILTTTLRGQCCYHPHIADETMEVQRLCPCGILPRTPPPLASMKDLFSAAGRCFQNMPSDVSPLWRLPLLKKTAFMARACLLPEAEAFNDPSSWGGKDLTPLLQPATTLKGHPTSRAPQGVSCGLQGIKSQSSFSLFLLSLLSSHFHKYRHQGLSLIHTLCAICFRVCSPGSLTNNKIPHSRSRLGSSRASI